MGPDSDWEKPDKHLAREDLAALMARGRVLEYKTHERPAIVCCTSGDGAPLLVKFWYPKNKLSSDLLHPYAKRFRNNARALEMRGIEAPGVRGWGDVEDSRIRYVSYPEIPGVTLRSDREHLDIDGLAGFLVEIHDRGVYFRALHLGNVLRTDEGGHALIDVGDCSFQRWPLNLSRRIKNLSGVCAHPEDLDFFDAGVWSRLSEAYRSRMSGGQPPSEAFAGRVRRGMERWQNRRESQRRAARARRRRRG